MNPLGIAIVSAAITLLKALVAQESGFITDEVNGVAGEGEASLQILLATDVPLDQKKIIWKHAGAAVSAALKKTEDEAANIPNDIGGDILPIVLKLLEVDFTTLL
jgi:hypothetical protein